MQLNDQNIHTDPFVDTFLNRFDRYPCPHCGDIVQKRAYIENHSSSRCLRSRGETYTLLFSVYSLILLIDMGVSC